jgi:hypothetical protein
MRRPFLETPLDMIEDHAHELSRHSLLHPRGVAFDDCQGPRSYR